MCSRTCWKALTLSGFRRCVSTLPTMQKSFWNCGWLLLNLRLSCEKWQRWQKSVGSHFVSKKRDVLDLNAAGKRTFRKLNFKVGIGVCVCGGECVCVWQWWDPFPPLMYYYCQEEDVGFIAASIASFSGVSLLPPVGQWRHVVHREHRVNRSGGTRVHSAPCSCALLKWLGNYEAERFQLPCGRHWFASHSGLGGRFVFNLQPGKKKYGLRGS